MATNKTMMTVVAVLAALLALVVAVVAYRTINYFRSIQPLAFKLADKLLAHLQKSVDPNEVQQWAVGMIQTNASGRRLAINELPDTLKKTQPSIAELIIGNSESNSSVVVIWGGGFGHWGLAAGNTNYQLNNLAVAYSNKWVDGLYIFADKE